MVGASILGTSNASGQRAKYSVNPTTYRLPVFETGNGPRQSPANRSWRNPHKF